MQQQGKVKHNFPARRKNDTLIDFNRIAQLLITDCNCPDTDRTYEGG